MIDAERPRDPDEVDPPPVRADSREEVEEFFGAAPVCAGILAWGTYHVVLQEAETPVQAAEFCGDLPLFVSVAVTFSRGVYSLLEDESLEAQYVWASRYLLPPFNLGFGVYAAALLLNELRAGRNAAGGLVLLGWSVLPAAWTLFRFGRWCTNSFRGEGAVVDPHRGDGDFRSSRPGASGRETQPHEDKP